MKANQKFLNGDNDEAVSPVIAVILMVAITVVLAATVYVWVSGFGSQSSQASKSMSLSTSSAIAEDAAGTNWKNYTVTAATPGMKYSDVKFTLNGAALACDDDGSVATNWSVYQGGSLAACDTTDGAGPEAVIGPGDRIQIVDTSGALSGKTLRILDSNANSVILTLNIG